MKTTRRSVPTLVQKKLFEYSVHSSKSMKKFLQEIDEQFDVNVISDKTHRNARIQLYYDHRDEKTQFESFVKKTKILLYQHGSDVTKNMNVDQVFIAFGTDIKPMHELRSYLSNLNIKPKIIGENTFGTESILEDLQSSIKKSKCAFIIMTPDDTCGCKSPRRRPRQNVIFEYGMFLSKLPKKCITVLHKGKFGALQLPSDLDGIKLPGFNKSILERKKSIDNTLKYAKVRAVKKSKKYQII